MPLSSTRVRVAIAATVTAVGVGLVSPPAASAAAGDGTGSTYANPVSTPDADTYADPAVIRGKDGHWYSYGTTDPLKEGESTRHLLPIMRSDDLVHWDYVGDAFTEASKPAWAEPDAALWAPDIRYVDGQYRLYYVVTETTTTGVPETTTEANDNAIGVAYSDSPLGPWHDSGDPVVDPRRVGPDNYKWTFDPHMVVGPGGREYLYYGSYYGGIWVTELTDEGSEATGEPTMVAIDNKYEGAYVVQRNGWWYLFASSANCCAGPTTGYSVHVGRSRNVTGPFVDREGVRMDQSRAGGTPVLYQNGNKWIGSGHNAIATDLAGQDWIVYHAIDRNDPYLTGREGINERPMLIDRLDWIGGWPITRAGAGPSQGSQPGPTTGGATVTDFTGGPGAAFAARGGWTPSVDDQSGAALRSTGPGANTVLTKASLPLQVRVEADLRRSSGSGEFGLTAAVNAYHDTAVTAVIDPATDRLVVRSTDGRTVTAQRTAALPAGYAYDEWHSLALEIRGGVARAELTNARLGDPLAVVSLPLPASAKQSGQAGAVARGAGAEVDNLSALKAAPLVTRRIPGPQPGTLLAGPSDEFNGGIEAGWQRVRTPDVSVANGRLVWPVEAKDLTGPRLNDRGEVVSNNAGILLRDAPAGNWTVETKLTIDLGTDVVRNFQQGGLIAYVNDDLFTRLSHVAIFNTRQTEFGKEMPYPQESDPKHLSYGGTIIGPPADTTWLRITHRIDSTNGEHELQASTSRDGRTWVIGGVWTLPKGADIRIGLISHGKQGDGESATSQFDYFRVYRD
jgi:arabinan endo-1,5-alpha-L-arabinosidase